MDQTIKIAVGNRNLSGILHIPENAAGIVIFAHSSGSSRFGPRNQFVAKALKKKGIATLLFDLLTKEEELLDLEKAHLRFDIELLANRLFDVTKWIRENPKTKHFSIAYFGSRTGAAAAFLAASKEENPIHAIVSRGGRPDLAIQFLPFVKCPVLLIVAEKDEITRGLNEKIFEDIGGEKKLEIIQGASEAFDEAGSLEKVAELTTKFLETHLQSR